MAVNAETRAYAREFNGTQRKAIKLLGISDEPLSNMSGVGQQTLDSLSAYGIVEQSGMHRHGEPTYRLTKSGLELHAALWELGWLR